MRNLFRSLPIIFGLAALPASAQAPLQVFGVTGNASTPSIDPHDPHPERSMYVAFDADRPVAPEEITVLQEPGALNNTTLGARYFQRPTSRGTWIIVVEVQSRPTTLGNASFVGFEVYLDWELAGGVQTAPPVSNTHHFTPRMFYIEPGSSGGFNLIAPKKSQFSAAVQHVDLMQGLDWEEPQSISPNGTAHWTGPNDRFPFDTSSMKGLINATAYLAGSDTFAQVTLLNMEVLTEEWSPLAVVQ